LAKITGLLASVLLPEKLGRRWSSKERPLMRAYRRLLPLGFCFTLFVGGPLPCGDLSEHPVASLPYASGSSANPTKYAQSPPPVLPCCTGLIPRDSDGPKLMLPPKGAAEIIHHLSLRVALLRHCDREPTERPCGRQTTPARRCFSGGDINCHQRLRQWHNKTYILLNVRIVTSREIPTWLAP